MYNLNSKDMPKPDTLLHTLHTFHYTTAILNIQGGDWKQWKWKLKMEMNNGNGKNLVQMNARVKPLINDHLLKTTSVQRPTLYKDHIMIMSQG